MNETLRTALLSALNRNPGDAMGVFYYLAGYLSVAPERDEELLAAIEKFNNAEKAKKQPLS